MITGMALSLLWPLKMIVVLRPPLTDAGSELAVNVGWTLIVCASLSLLAAALHAWAVPLPSRPITTRKCTMCGHLLARGTLCCQECGLKVDANAILAESYAAMRTQWIDRTIRLYLWIGVAAAVGGTAVAMTIIPRPRQPIDLRLLVLEVAIPGVAASFAPWVLRRAWQMRRRPAAP